MRFLFVINAQVIITKNIDYLLNKNYDNDKDLLENMPQGKKEVPILIYFYGGALLDRNKSMGRDIENKVALSGFGLVSVNERLSSEFEHPAHVNDRENNDLNTFSYCGI
jgi:acetyl esterase/lipase